MGGAVCPGPVSCFWSLSAKVGIAGRRNIQDTCTRSGVSSALPMKRTCGRINCLEIYRRRRRSRQEPKKSSLQRPGRKWRLRPNSILRSLSGDRGDGDEMAKRYLENALVKDQVTTEQVYCVYKIICASESFIKAKYFGKRSKDQATACYRQLARNLHPDKNKHPFSAEAFLKISSIYATTMANA